MVAWLPVVVATLAGFALGYFWYGPLFGKAWMAERGVTAADLAKDFNPGLTYGLTFLLGLIAAYVFGIFLGPDAGFGRAAFWGFAVGLVWVAGSMATNALFGRQSLKLWLINAGYHVARFTLVGAAFGVFG